MATDVSVPKLGMNTESVTIVRWLKREGDDVAVGDVLADVETDKTTTELEAEAGGVLRKCLAAEGERVSVNQVIAVIGGADEDISAHLARANGTPDAHEYVERVYKAWRQQGAHNPANPSPASVRPAATPPAPATAPMPALTPARPAAEGGIAGNGSAVPKPDVDSIRARLVQRGVLPAPAVETRAKTRLVIYGAGLGAKQLLEVTRHLKDVEVVGLVDDNPDLAGVRLGDVAVLGGSARLAELLSAGAIDGVALSFHSEVRRKVHRRLVTELGARMIALVDPRAMVGMDVTIGPGALVEAGAVIGPGTTVGEGTIVDVGAVVAHDCYLGSFSHLSPGACLSGVVNLTENVLVGVGAAINSTVTVGRNVIIAPGAAVMNDVPDDAVVSGVPAKTIGHSRRGA
jgi:sugar O-acyltransferase (sialic acid O-acetyltransferase NeuD family)